MLEFAVEQIQSEHVYSMKHRAGDAIDLLVKVVLSDPTYQKWLPNGKETEPNC